MSHHRIARLATATLLGGASLTTLGAVAHAQTVLFSTSSEVAGGTTLDIGREITVAKGTVQVKLPGGGIASFVDSAHFSLRDDGSVDLRTGSVTVVGASGATVAVHMPEGVRGTVAGTSAATFTANANGSRGSTTSGAVSVVSNGVTKSFSAGQFWTAGADRAPDRVIAGSAAAVPGARADGPVRPMLAGGVIAAAENGVPVALGEGLAGVGASGDVVAAARRIEAYDANPTIPAFPTGDYATLVQYAAQANGLLGAGGTTFNGAGADIIRTYFEYLAAGNAGPNFRTAYAGVLLNYLDLLRSGVLPSTFRGATQAQLNAYLAFIGRTDGFGALSVSNRQLLDAYLAFLGTGGTADAFGGSVTNLTTSFLNYVRGGGNPATFTQASASVVAQYLAIVNSGGLRTNLTAQNQALLTAYLANNGIDFTSSYATGLAAFVAYLNAGGLPSGYTALPQATVRQYLETLETTGLFDSVLGVQSVFLRSYLTFLRGGGTADQFNALPINVARVNASNLSIYVEYLLAGGAPTAYGVLTQAQIRAALDQLTATGQFNTLLGINAAFLSEYYAYIRTGADADTFAGLPSVDVTAYAASLQLFAAYLRAGNLPSAYGTLTAQQIRSYLTALQVGGKLSLLGDNATLLGDYLTYVRTGGAPDAFAGLPIVTYQSYATALTAYFAYLNAGGLPSGYAALTQAQLRTYLDVLRSNGQFTLLGSNATFYTNYLMYLAGGGAVDAFTGLPIVTFQGYAAALTAYFAYLNAGGLPSGYTVLTQAQVRQYLDALSANAQLTALLGSNAAFFTQYRAFLLTGASVDAFAGLPIVTYQAYATALNAYYAFLIGGGTPGGYTVLTQTQIRSYLDALKAAGQVGALLGTNAAFFTQYLAFLETGGVANVYPGLPSSAYGQYASALNLYFAYLNGGGLPSGYTALTQAQIREYLSVLQANNQLAALLGGNATFFADYLTFVSGGGVVDAFTGLPIVTYRSYASALTAYYAFLAGGGLPANYTTLTQAQIRQYLDALAAANQITALLGQNAVFFSQYQTYLAGGGAPNGFSGLPSMTYAQYGTSLGAFVAFLRGNGLPGGYTTLTSAQIREYLAVLQANGQLGLIGSAADQQLLTAYAAYLASGGVPNQFAGLPAFVTYEAALRTYYAFLQGGGRPSTYTALTQAQIVAYIGALDAAGLVMTRLTADEAKFLRDYAAYVSAGNNADQFAGLPGNQPPSVPVVTQGLAGAPRASTNTLATAISGKGVFSSAVTTGTVAVTGNTVNSVTGQRAAVAQNTTTVEARTVDNTIAIAKLINGTYNNGSANVQVDGQSGAHLVWGTPAVNVPTSGTATFGMVAATSPTRDGGGVDPGTFTGNFGVSFASRMVGWDSVIAIGGVNYRFASAGGIATPSIALTTTNTFNGAASTASNGLAGTGTGFLSGVNGNLLGFAFLAQGPGANGEIEGTAIFGRGAPAVTLPAVTPPSTQPGLGYAYTAGLPTSGLRLLGAIPLGNNQQVTQIVDAVSATPAADGTLTTINGAGSGSYLPIARGTAKSVDVAGNARVVVGRWSDGRISPSGLNDVTLTANQGYHYALAAPISFVVPTTGRVDYTLAAATRPTFGSGATAPGVFDARMSILFRAAPLIGLAGTIVMPEASGATTYAFTTVGGVATPSASPLGDFTRGFFQIDAGMTGNGLACTGSSCFLRLQGSLTGSDPLAASAVYRTFAGGQSNIAEYIAGAAAFTGVAVTDSSAPANLPAPTGYTYTAGLATNSLYVRSIHPGGGGGGIGASTLQSGSSVTRDASGALLTSSNASTQDLTRITAKATDTYGDTRAVIGRWYDGTYRVGANNAASLTLSATQSLHYVQLAPGSFSIPTSGQVHYALLAATQPTFSSGATGAGLFDGKMALLFTGAGAFKTAIEGTIRMPEVSGTVTYSFSTPGGVAGVAGLTGSSLNSNIISIIPTLTGSGLACTTDCRLNVIAGFGGSDVNRIGLTYYSQDARGTSSPSIQGAAVFTGTLAASAATTVADRLFVAIAPSAANPLNPASGSYEIDAQGRVTGLISFNGLTDRLGTAQIAESGATAGNLIGWTRWSNGTLATTRNGPSTSVLNANQGYQILHGAAVSALPASGTIAYNLVGGTKPTDHAGTLAPGTLVSGSAAVLFGSTVKAAFDLTAQLGGNTYNIFTTGKIAGIASSEITIGANGKFDNIIGPGGNVTSADCPAGSCRPIWSGVLAGAGAGALGVNYQVQNTSTQARFGGIAAFDKGGAITAAATVQNQAIIGLGDAGSLDARAFSQTGPVSYDGQNRITGFGRGSTINVTSGTAEIADSGRVAGIVGWSRWTNGAPSDPAYGPYTANQSLHLVAGTAATNRPTSGTVSYTAIGATKPTLTDGSAAPGTLTGSMAVSFGGLPKVGLDLRMVVGNYGWTVATNGGVANPGNSELSVNANSLFGGGLTAVSTTPASCQNQQCFATVAGQLYGEGASHAGLTLTVGYDRANGQQGQANGAIVFAKAP